MKELDTIDISRNDRDTEGRKNKAGSAAGKSTEVHEKNRAVAPKQSQELARQRQRARRKRERERRRKRIKRTILIVELLLIALFCIMLYQIIRGVSGNGRLAAVFSTQEKTLIRENTSKKPEITEDFLTVNEYSRPGTELKRVKNIFVHYTANPGTSAAQNRSYFENLGITEETSASAHFVIGYEGEIVQCIPLDEMAYAVKKRNEDSISIECCYLDESGEFTRETYQSLLLLSAWLLKEYRLSPADMRRHYDEGGKMCPLYYVEHEDAWEQFLTDLEIYILDNAGAADETAAL